MNYFQRLQKAIFLDVAFYEEVEKDKKFTDQAKDNYLNKDFTALKQSLMNYAKSYFPDTYRDFNETSPGMMLIELSSYLGDVLSYNDDYNYKNTIFSEIIEKTDKLFYKELRKDFKLAQKNGDLRRDTPVDFYIYMMESIKEKMADSELKKIYQDEKAMLMDLTNFFFYGIMAK